MKFLPWEGNRTVYSITDKKWLEWDISKCVISTIDIITFDHQGFWYPDRSKMY